MKKYLSCIILTTILLCFSNLAFANDEETSIIVLSGDIGGTNARLRLTQLKNNQKQVLANKTYAVKNYNNSIDIIRHFLKEYNHSSSDINSMCLAVNEPIANGRSESYDAEQLKKELSINKVILINDLEAAGYGIESIDEKDLLPLQVGTPEKNGVKAFIAAGTWLGTGFASFDGTKYVVHPSEGGQTNFAPADPTQLFLLSYLMKKSGAPSISTETLLRGNGITIIYNCFLNTVYKNRDNKQLRNNLENSQDQPKEIANFALTNTNDLVSTKTLETFVNIYSAKAQDVAYTFLPRGGLYIIGNIAANILNKDPYNKIFIKPFEQSSFLKNFPVWLVLNSEIGVQGAESCAFRLALTPIQNLNES